MQCWCNKQTNKQTNTCSPELKVQTGYTNRISLDTKSAIQPAFSGHHVTTEIVIALKWTTTQLLHTIIVLSVIWKSSLKWGPLLLMTATNNILISNNFAGQ